MGGPSSSGKPNGKSGIQLGSFGGDVNLVGENTNEVVKKLVGNDMVKLGHLIGLKDNELVNVKFMDKKKVLKMVHEGDKTIISADIDPVGKSLRISGMFLDKTGTGEGTARFNRIKETAKDVGLKTITLDASRGPGVNGYYTWARLGFDGKLSQGVLNKLEGTGIKATNVSDLMKTSKGKNWWKDNGESMEMTYKL